MAPRDLSADPRPWAFHLAPACLAAAIAALTPGAPILALVALAGLLLASVVAGPPTARVKLDLSVLVAAAAVAAALISAGPAAALAAVLAWRVAAELHWSAGRLLALARVEGPADGPLARWVFLAAPVLAAGLALAGGPLGAALGAQAPLWAVWLAIGGLGVAAVDWVTRRLAAWRLDALAAGQAAHMAAHGLAFGAVAALSGEPAAGLAGLVAWRLASAAAPGLRAHRQRRRTAQQAAGRQVAAAE